MKLHSRFHWERQFQDAYTKDIFKKFRKEITDMIYCHLDPNNEIIASSIPGVEKLNIKECSITNWSHYLLDDLGVMFMKMMNPCNPANTKSTVSTHLGVSGRQVEIPVLSEESWSSKDLEQSLNVLC
ncbi:hypothetical protein Syun_016837 [Stephania yunnanensis]|uniref:Uncharacterized protein n=1 Tax=Stephania yunnanensis TaxID=152371 RepID=A0AAP0J7E3_9MAGN